MEFVVHVTGEEPEKGHWVLAIGDAGGRQFLIADDTGAFRWIPIADCTFVRAANPDIPRPVVLIQPQQGLAMPQLQVGNGRGR